jgi:hypothetical protein
MYLASAFSHGAAEMKWHHHYLRYFLQHYHQHPQRNSCNSSDGILSGNVHRDGGGGIDIRLSRLGCGRCNGITIICIIFGNININTTIGNGSDSSDGILSGNVHHDGGNGGSDIR